MHCLILWRWRAGTRAEGQGALSVAVVAVQDIACIDTVSILSGFVHLWFDWRWVGLGDDKIDLKCNGSLQRFKEDC